MTSSHELPQVTVVVPTKNSAATLKDCLKSIREQTIPCNLVVVDNNSTDETTEIGAAFADLLLRGGPERSAQRNEGAFSSSSQIVGFVDSDMVLSSVVLEEVLAAVEAGAKSVVVPERTVGEGFWARVSAYERSFYEGSATIEAPRFFPSTVFKHVGGFDENMTGAEDWDLGLRTASCGPRVRINAAIIHDEGRASFIDMCRKKAYYAPGVALFVRKHGAVALVGASQRPWLRHPRALMKPLGLGLVALKIGESLSMMAGVVLSVVGRRPALPSRRGAGSGSNS